MRIGTAAEDDCPPKSRYQLAVEVDGFNLDATTALSGTDRKRVERLCRYLLRGPVSLERLSIDANGNAVYRLRKPDRQGRTELVMTPHQLLARLTAQIPAPHLCLRRGFEVLAPRAPLRPKVVPVKAAPVVPPHIPGAQLIKAAFGTDPECCRKCGGKLVAVALCATANRPGATCKGRGATPNSLETGTLRDHLFARPHTTEGAALRQAAGHGSAGTRTVRSKRADPSAEWHGRGAQPDRLEAASVDD